MGTWGIGHWLIVLLIAVLLFGTKKIGNIGGDVANAIKSFRKGLQDDDRSAQAQLKADPDTASTPAGNESKQETKP